MSTGVIAGLILIGYAAHRPRTATAMVALVEAFRITSHIEGGSRMARTRHPNVTPGEDFTGYS